MRVQYIFVGGALLFPTTLLDLIWLMEEPFIYGIDYYSRA